MNLLFIILRVVFFVFIPSFLVYLGSEVSLFDILKKDRILGDDFNILFAKQICLILSVFITSIVLVSLYEYKNYKFSLVNIKNLSLIADLKISFLSALAKQLNNDHLKSIKFRVWKEKKGLLTFIKNTYYKLKGIPIKRYLTLVEIQGLSDIDNTKDLYFEVEPTQQGLVGICYNKNTIQYEEDAIGTESMYNLNPFQISKTRDTRFILCFPIVNKDIKVVSVISLDSIYAIKIPEDQEGTIANMITIFSQDLIKYFPKLLK